MHTYFRAIGFSEPMKNLDRLNLMDDIMHKASQRAYTNIRHIESSTPETESMRTEFSLDLGEVAKWAMLVWAFVMGITLDIFANTPGVCAASLTLAAMAQPSLLELFVTREGDSDFIPSRLVMGKKPFFNYVALFVVAYCMVFFTLEMFSFFNFLKWLECVLGSTVLTVALIMAVDSLRRIRQ